VEEDLLIRSGENLRLTNRGRLLSNEVFQRFIVREELVREIDSA
jgi:coproporphyrinogen III oxidase-like Fe-S oxidoreductase